MGKRNKEVQQVGRRRPMLQLGSSSKKTGLAAMSRNSAKLQEPIPKIDPVPVDNKGNDELAGFLAEINSLEGPPTTEVKVEKSTAASTTAAIYTATTTAAVHAITAAVTDNVSLLYDPANFDPSTQGHLLPQPWEAAYDESTGYYYYWNTITNEVQWYPPVATLPPPPPPEPLPPEPIEKEKKVSKQKDMNTTQTLTKTSDINGKLEPETVVNDLEEKSLINDQKDSQDENDLKMNEPTASNEKVSINNRILAEYGSSSPEEQEDIDDTSMIDEDKINPEIKTETKIKAIEGYEDSPEIEEEIQDQEDDEKKLSDTEEQERAKREAEEQLRLEEEDKIRKQKEEEQAKREREEELAQKEKELALARKEREEKEKERLEMERLHKEALLQKEREALLREKLSRKKKEREEAEKRMLIEREKMLMKEAAADSDEEESQKSLNDSNVIAEGEKTESDDFSMDMFSTADDSNTTSDDQDKLKRVSEKPPLPESKKNDKASLSLDKKQKEEAVASLKVPKKIEATKAKSSPKRFPKGSWRIIDAGYDDETSDDDDVKPQFPPMPPEEVKPPMPPDEDKPPMPPMEDKPPMPPEEDRPPLPPGPPDMDDYADMLLENVSRKHKSREPSSRYKQKEDIKKKKKKKREHDHPLPPPLPPPQPDHRRGNAPPPEPPSDDFAPPPPPPPPPLPEEDRPPAPSHSPDKEREILSKIDSISVVVAEKLRFLDVTRESIKDLHVYLIELETRMEDWRKGALETKYLLSKLEDLDTKVMHYEESSAPTGWLCHWSKDFHMYYYYNTMTGESQWDYPNAVVPPPPPPDEPVEQPLTTSKDSMLHSLDSVRPLISTSETSSNEIFPVSHGVSMEEQLLHARVTLTESSTTASVPSLVSATKRVLPSSSTVQQLSIPAVRGDKEAPPPETDNTPSKKTTADPYRDPYRLVKKKKMQEAARLQDSPVHSPSHGGDSEPGTQSPLQAGTVIAAAPLILSQESISAPALPKLEVLSGGSSPSRNDTELIPVRSKIKRKKVATSGLASKKLKQVSSLVQKWQTVKQRAEEEEQVEDDYEEDQEVLSERRIEEWKQEVQESGAANYNPNFETIKGDWRERLKRKMES